ncbi:MAG TPA: tRNA lysidine(34) synthetase TilS [Candidatus Hydrogenedentes bacterium]|nr:tRNA lysidine(34) synthetase TilS [Candidatus Hydrogenedentota bacterium]
MNTPENRAHDEFTARLVVEEVEAFINRYRLLSEGEAVLAAVSGGGDSMALLGILGELGYPVTVAHFDHGTRGGQSAEDAAFVATMCERLDVPLVMERVEVANERQRGESFEMAARRLRYAFLKRVATERELVVATGHQADDQAETVLMRLQRGAGARGLAGISPTRMLGMIRLIRPLLQCRREALRAYLRARKIPWREDATNADPSISRRNWIRRNLLGTKGDSPEDPVEDLLQLAEMSRVTWWHIMLDLARACMVTGLPVPESGARAVSRSILEHLDPYLRRVWWLLWMESLGHEPTRARVEALETWLTRGRTGSCFPLGKAGTIYLGRESLVVTRKEPMDLVPEETATLGIEGGALVMGGWRLRWEVRPISESERSRPRESCGPWRQLLDADRLHWPLRARFFRPGDRIRPLGMGGRSKKIQDYFTDRGVPVPKRRRLPLVESGGEIVWVAGQGPSETARITASTRQVVEIEAVPGMAAPGTMPGEEQGRDA